MNTININMRCIEITETVKNEPTSYTININMRCIEINSGLSYHVSSAININMRCIEITATCSILVYKFGLTLT